MQRRGRRKRDRATREQRGAAPERLAFAEISFPRSQSRMRNHRPVLSVRLPPELAVKRDFDTIADARRLESLRQAIRREVGVRSSLRSLAQQIGVDRGSLRKFLTMESVPGVENLAKIEDWSEERPEVCTPLGAVALGLLVLDPPAPRRGPTREQLARVIAAAFADAKLPVPEWLDAECGG